MLHCEEIDYTEECINIPHRGKYLKDIYIKCEFDVLPKNYRWMDFFIFKYLKNIEIEINGHLWFNTNGLIIKTRIDTHEQKSVGMLAGINTECPKELNELSKKHMCAYIPLHLPFKIPLNEFPENTIKLYTETNDYVTVPHMKNPPIKLSYILNYDETDENEKGTDPWHYIINLTKCKRIEISKEYNYSHTFKYKFLSPDYIKYLLFYIDGDIKISNISVTFEDTSISYSYEHMNLFLPYQGLQRMPTERELYVPLTNINGTAGQYEITFTFSKNDGGNVYLLWEDTDLVHIANNSIYLKYCQVTKADDWLTIGAPNDHIKELMQDVVITITI